MQKKSFSHRLLLVCAVLFFTAGMIFPGRVFAGTVEDISSRISNAKTVADLQILINRLRLLVDDLNKQVQNVLRERAFTVSVLSASEDSTIVAGSKGASFAKLTVHASMKDVRLNSIALTLEAPENNSQKGISNCRLLDGIESKTNGVDPFPSKQDTQSITFVFPEELFVAKGTSKAFMLACDVTKNPEGPAAYTWRLGASAAKTITLIREGSFILELADATPGIRAVSGGSQGEQATLFDFYAAGEAVELKTLALRIDGNPKAVSAYKLFDGTRQVGGGVLSGDIMFKAELSESFIIPQNEHKVLTVSVDLMSIKAGGLVHAEDSVAVNFNGDKGNSKLTYGIGVSSGRGIVPSVFTDTDAPAMLFR